MQFGNRPPNRRASFPLLNFLFSSQSSLLPISISITLRSCFTAAALSCSLSAALAATTAPTDPLNPIPDVPVKEVAQAIAADADQSTAALQLHGTLPDQSGAGDSKSSTDSSSSAPKSKKLGIGGLIKANIVESFQLDPRMQKDLTDSPVLLSPIRLIQDNFAVGYNPSITWEKSPGSNKWPTTYAKRNLALYWVGPVTKHESVWLQMTPASGAHGFCQNWELLQGTANYGSDKNFIHAKGGIIFNWQNAGFGGADRTITQTSPAVYSAFNGFDPTANSRGASIEATGLNWTTGKIFTYFQQPPTQTSADPNIQYNRSYGGGLSFEKLFGKEGISGIQSNLTVGSTNLFNSNPSQATQVNQYNASQAAEQAVNQANAALQAQANAASQATIQANQALQAQANAQFGADMGSGLNAVAAEADAQNIIAAAGGFQDPNAAAQAVIANAGGLQDPNAAGTAAASNVPTVPIGHQTSPFVCWTSWINHSFQDKEGYIRANPSFGLTTMEVKRYYDDPSIPENRSKGYAYTFDLMTVPVRSYWTNILRFDAYNGSDLIHRNTQYTFTVGNAWDFHCGNKSRIRLTLDYQLIGQQGSTADQRFILGFWPIW